MLCLQHLLSFLGNRRAGRCPKLQINIADLYNAANSRWLSQAGMGCLDARHQDRKIRQYTLRPQLIMRSSMQLCKDGRHSLASQNSLMTISMSSESYPPIEVRSLDTRDWDC